MQEVVVTNRGTSITLSRHTLLLLQRLARQMPSSSQAAEGCSGGGGAGASLPVTASFMCGSDGGSSAGTSLACSAGTIGEVGRALPGVNVMEGVVQAAYASSGGSLRRHLVERPLEASVFLDGGWWVVGGWLAGWLGGWVGGCRGLPLWAPPRTNPACILLSPFAQLVVVLVVCAHSSC